MISQVRAVEPLAAVGGGRADERAGEGLVWVLGYLKLRILLLLLIILKHGTFSIYPISSRVCSLSSIPVCPLGRRS
jgi:hypothetical protein